MAAIVSSIRVLAQENLLRYTIARNYINGDLVMRAPYLISLLGLTIVLGACAGQQTTNPRMPEKGDPAYFKVRDSIADEVYVNQDTTKGDWLDGVRRIYIAPTNTSRTQIIQPRGVRSSDLDAWVMTDDEQVVLQNKFAKEMTRALEVDNAFYVVNDRSTAQAVIHSNIVAVHPYQARSVGQAGGKVGGAVTMTFSLVDPMDDKVMIHLLDSKSTNNIWAFDQMDNDKTALDLIFAEWGNQFRRSVLFLQGRLSEIIEPPAMQMKTQERK